MAIIGTVIYFGFLTSYVNAYPITLKFIILVTIFDMFKIDIIQARIWYKISFSEEHDSWTLSPRMSPDYFDTLNAYQIFQ